MFVFAFLIRMLDLHVSTNVNHDNVIKWNHFRAQALCDGNPPGESWILLQRPVTRSFGVFFDVRLNKSLSKWYALYVFLYSYSTYRVGIMVAYLYWEYIMVVYSILKLRVPIYICFRESRIKQAAHDSRICDPWLRDYMWDFCTPVVLVQYWTALRLIPATLHGYIKLKMQDSGKFGRWYRRWSYWQHIVSVIDKLSYRQLLVR